MASDASDSPKRRQRPTPVASAVTGTPKLNQWHTGDRHGTQNLSTRVATCVQEGDRQSYHELFQICVSLGELQQNRRREINISIATDAEDSGSSGRYTRQKMGTIGPSYMLHNVSVPYFLGVRVHTEPEKEEG